MAREFWIAEIRATSAVKDKLRRKHGLTIQEVRAACVPDTYDWAGWDDDPKHGERLLVETHDDDGKMRIWLQEVDVAEGIWKLRTAWRRTT